MNTPSKRRYFPDGIRFGKLNPLQVIGFLFITFLILIIGVLLFFVLYRGKIALSGSDGNLTVIATSSWTAAYATVAGAKNVKILAPLEMAHPSEYELRPGDIPKLMKAGTIIYAGYEVITERLKKGLGLPADKLMQIDTDYGFESMEKSIMKIAAKLNTESIARENIAEIRSLYDHGKKVVEEKGLTGLPVIAHRFQSSFVRELGFVPIMIFGPGSPEALEIIAVSKMDAVFIADNFHNPVGQPFKDVLQGVYYVQLLNFPGQKSTQTLTDVIRYNMSQFINE